jgi:hypothetical protein
VTAISSFGGGFLLLFTTAALNVRGQGGQAGAWLVPAALGSVGLGSVLSLPGMVLGLASLEQKGRSKRAGVAGCLMNGLILGFWLFLCAGPPICRALGQAYSRGSRVPVQAYPDGTDFFSR